MHPGMPPGRIHSRRSRDAPIFNARRLHCAAGLNSAHCHNRKCGRVNGMATFFKDLTLS